MASRTARTCPDCHGTGHQMRGLDTYHRLVTGDELPDCDTCDGAGLVDLTPNPAAVQAHELELRVLARRHRD